MTTTKDNLRAMAETHGWTITEPNGPLLMVFERKAPMIDRRDENLLTVYLGPRGARVRAASYGPQHRPHPIARSIPAVIKHLIIFGR